MWGSHLSSDGLENYTTGIEIVLAFWQIPDNVVLIMLDTG
jgi:hypothetical protein